MRIVFIHGFGENEAIFDKISPFISGEHLFVNVWTLVGDVPRNDLNVLSFAQRLVEKYGITRQDVIIGHSMGGWIAYHIKHFTNSPIVQIGSWTDADRPYSPIKNEKVIYWVVRNGLFFNRFMKRYSVKRAYESKPSRQVYEEIFDQMTLGNKENIINQLRLILSPISEKLTVIPDLRIHARADLVVRIPREPFHEVPGDHFTLQTNPETVYEPILAFLKALKQD
jgi:pimeloyl-ACP methyl ester carboxylesterase